MQMDREELMQFVLDHYEHPRNYGASDDADVVQKGGNPGCGDIVTVFLHIGSDGKIEKISFEGEGCIISQAGTSIITEKVLGKTLEEVENMGTDVITDILGKELAMARPKCTTLGITTVKRAIKELHRQNTMAEISKGKTASG